MKKMKVLKNDKQNFNLKKMLDDFERGKEVDRLEFTKALFCSLTKNKEYFHNRNVSRRRALKAFSRLAGFNKYIVRRSEVINIISQRILAQEKALI